MCGGNKVGRKPPALGRWVLDRLGGGALDSTNASLKRRSASANLGGGICVGMGVGGGGEFVVKRRGTAKLILHKANPTDVVSLFGQPKKLPPCMPRKLALQ